MKEIKNPKMLFQDEQYNNLDDDFDRTLIVFCWMLVILIPLLIIFLNIKTVGG